MPVRNAESMGSYGATWEAGGYCGSGSVGSLIGSLRGRPAVIAGGAEGVFQELSDALTKLDDPVIFAANDIGMFLPKVDHWVSLHGDHLGPWKMVRWLHPKDREDVKLHSEYARPYIDYVWQGLTPLFCLSGYFAMQIAWIMGASPIVLCGCPGSPRRRFFDLPDTDRGAFGYGMGQRASDTGTREQIEREMERLPEFKAAVRSQSGWTREFFGSL